MVLMQCSTDSGLLNFFGNLSRASGRGAGAGEWEAAALLYDHMAYMAYNPCHTRVL
jgi:hypothetical protein